MSILDNRVRGWILSSLFISLLSITNVLADHQLQSVDKIPQQCSTNCETSYGNILGKSPAGVLAYSNCNSDCVIFEPNYLHKVYTGIKWQCVEYARRWLLNEQGVVFGDVDIAADIWAIAEVNNPHSTESLKFYSIVNGAANLPQRGDLLIYGKQYLDTGHVAVVVSINEKRNTIQVAEQNYANTKWQQNYAREIAYISVDNRIWLLDSYLIGWKRVQKIKH